MGVEPLTDEALNRAYLARQHLLARTRDSTARVVEHLVGLQAQEPQDPYVSLWSRIRDFRPESLGGLLRRRRAVRATLMRATLHLVTSRDAVPLRRLMQPAVARTLREWRRVPPGLNRDAVARAGKRLLSRTARGWSELDDALAREFPGCEKLALARIVQARVGTVQVPPRGLFRVSAPPRIRSLDAWTRGTKPARLDAPRLVLRYLRAFGPASPRDMQAWSGLTRLAPLFDRLGDRLVRLRSASGATLYDVADAPRPDAGVPAPPRFLPVFDNLVLGLKDRRRVMPKGVKLPSTNPNDGVRYVLVDGVLGATWTFEDAKGSALLRVMPLARVTAAVRRALREEAEGFVEFLAPDARRRTVRIG